MNAITAKRHRQFLVLIFILSYILGAPSAMATFFGKSELSGVWKERFQDVSKLNEYTGKGFKSEISDVVIKDYKLDGAIFNNVSFSDVEWTGALTTKAVFTNSVFRNNIFKGVEFTDAKFTNVTFEDSEFYGSSFYLSQLSGAKFIHCKFLNDSDFVQLKDSTINFDFTTLETVSFADSKAILAFRNSSLSKVRLIDLALPSSLTFENSKLEDVDWSRSNLTKLVMEKVTGGGDSGTNGGSFAEVEIRDNDMSFGLQEASIGKLTIINSRVRNNFRNSEIKTFTVLNCKRIDDMGLYQSKIETLTISNCPINNLRPIESTIQSFSIEKSSIANSKFEGMNAKFFTLTDVTLDQNIDFSGAQVEHLNTKNVTKGAGLILKLDGSNVKF